MSIFLLTSSEVAFLLIKLGLPPLEDLVFPREANHPLEVLRALQQAGQRLQKRGLLRVQETTIQVSADLARLLRIISYPEQWSNILAHDREAGLLQRTWYRDSEGQIAFHQAFGSQHFFAPGSEDMGQNSLLELLTGYRSTLGNHRSELASPTSVTFSMQDWQTYQKRRVSGGGNITSDTAPLFWQDFLTAQAVLVWQRLSSITPLRLEETVYVLGSRVWRVVREEKSVQMKAESISWEVLFEEVESAYKTLEKAWTEVQTLLRRLQQGRTSLDTLSGTTSPRG